MILSDRFPKRQAESLVFFHPIGYWRSHEQREEEAEIAAEGCNPPGHGMGGGPFKPAEGRRQRGEWEEGRAAEEGPCFFSIAKTS
jgi:hypothetical protein